MNELEQRLREYITKLEAQAGRQSSVEIQRKSYVPHCFAVFGVLLLVVLLFKERK